MLTLLPFSGKPSTPWGPGTVHDFMHAKVTVADDTVFVGSFNLSRSGEMNAENVLEIRDAALADGWRCSSTRPGPLPGVLGARVSAGDRHHLRDLVGELDDLEVGRRDPPRGEQLGPIQSTSPDQ